MGEKGITYKRMVDIQEAVSYLEALAQSLRDGSVAVAHGDKALDLEPPSVVVLEIEAKQKKDKSKFGFEIAWKHTDDGDGGGPLKISSRANAIAGDETSVDD
ncbi:MAG: amphi-Trp domain-containing protein [Desulfobacterales bacterium]|jgi:amphi-Trp domain-containing protein